MSEVFDLTIDLDSLTIAEIEEVESLTDRPFDALFDGGKKGTALRALAFIIKRRDDAAFSWEDAGALRINLKVAEVDPTEAGES